jgi:hypothetical protein
LNLIFRNEVPNPTQVVYTSCVLFSIGQAYDEQKRLVSDSLLCGGCGEENPKVSLSNGAVSNGGIPKDECYVQIDDL